MVLFGFLETLVFTSLPQRSYMVGLGCPSCSSQNSSWVQVFPVVTKNYVALKVLKSKHCVYI